MAWAARSSASARTRSEPAFSNGAVNSFTATVAPVRVSVPRHTSARPPRPMGASIRYGPNVAPGLGVMAASG